MTRAQRVQAGTPGQRVFVDTNTWYRMVPIKTVSVPSCDTANTYRQFAPPKIITSHTNMTVSKGTTIIQRNLVTQPSFEHQAQDVYTTITVFHHSETSPTSPCISTHLLEPTRTCRQIHTSSSLLQSPIPSRELDCSRLSSQFVCHDSTLAIPVHHPADTNSTQKRSLRGRIYRRNCN